MLSVAEVQSVHHHQHTYTPTHTHARAHTYTHTCVHTQTHTFTPRDRICQVLVPCVPTFWCAGSVVEIDSDEDDGDELLYHVLYDDGDEEDLYLSEIRGETVRVTK